MEKSGPASNSRVDTENAGVPAELIADHGADWPSVLGSPISLEDQQSSVDGRCRRHRIGRFSTSESRVGDVSLVP